MDERRGRGSVSLRLVLSVALPLIVGGAAGWATAQGVGDWYPTLVKPPFNPPGWVFAPVWTLLYVLMGVAFFLVWMKGTDTPGVPRALLVYAFQLALNFLWSFFFFYAGAPGWALLEILLLLAALSWTLLLFFRVSRLAGWLMTPYLGWVTFATVLNAAIWILNR